MPTPVGVPTNKVEVEFTAGVWTDVSADVELAYQGPLTTRFGRTSQFSQPSPASMTLSLRNELGRYTPGRQVLTDGTTPHLYWPNVLPRKRIRRSYTIAGTTYTRFLGYIKGWPPALLSGVRPYVTINATTRDDQLSRVTMQSPLMTEYLADTPTAFWPLTDAAGDTAAAQQGLDMSGNMLTALTIPTPYRGQAALTFGDNGPGFGDGSGVKFSPASATSGQFLQAFTPLGSLGAFTFELWVNPGVGLPAWVTGTAVETVLRVFRNADAAFDGTLIITPAGYPSFRLNSGGTITSARSIIDGGWHHVVITRASSGGSCSMWIDGVRTGGTVSSPAVTNMDTVSVGVGANSTARFQGNVGYVAVYPAVLSNTRIGVHYTAGHTGYAGDLTDDRIKRYLGVAGLTSGDWNLDAGQITINHYPQAGKDITSACQDMATSEGGGAAFYVAPDGRTRFVNRRFRDNRTPVLVLDASVPSLLDPDSYSPAFDETTIVNTATASRSAESGSLSTQTYTNTASAAAYGPANPGGGLTTYTTSDLDALNLAQWQVAGNAQPAFRLNQVTVRMHAATSSLYAALGQVEIGSRIRIVNLPANAAPTSTLDLFVEGWTETVDAPTYTVVFDTSAADNRGKWDTSRATPDPGQAQMNALLLAASTTVVIKTLSGPTFTTTSGSYPLDIHVGEEDITLNTAPGGSTSPQTFTGVTRHANNTVAADHQTNAVVTLAPAYGWAL
jgi:hypothetical protein